MRASLPIAFLLSILLSACASFKSEIPPSKHISQNGPLKVHPGLLGKPVPAELQPGSSLPVPAASSTAPAASVTPDTLIKMDPVGLRTQRSVYFDLNNATVKADYEPALRAHASYLAEHPKARVRIEGNADERGSAAYNQQLGLRRAENVRATLARHGARKKQITIKTLGASNPKKTGHDEESWAENRRSDVVYEREE
ncbi:MAG: OmpA family protein [Azonexaceae bacterium]|nr:OmpA family protein [Azonexaceae bacterium]